MGGQTPRFALNFFGGDVAGSLSDDNDKYTGEDRLSLDRVLAALEAHNHHLTAAMDVPDTDVDLSLPTGASGTLNAGVTYYYCVSFVDAAGLETTTGPETSIATPDVLLTPEAPSGETSTQTGSTLLAGLYYYGLTGLREAEESSLGALGAVTVLTGENTTTLTLPDLGTATSYQIWRMKDTDPGWTRIATSTSGTYLDTGAVPAGHYGDPTNIPPTSGTGVASYAIDVALAGDDITSLDTATSWRIYRSETSGVYSSASLVHEVIERTSDTDPTAPLMTHWLDDGDAQLTGSPKQFATALLVPSREMPTAVRGNGS